MQKVLINLFLLSSFLLLNINGAKADGKKKMDYTIYDNWKSIDRGYTISNDGQFVSYVIKPQYGDSYLYVYNVHKQKLDSVPRGKSPMFSPEGNFLTYRISAHADSIRQLKLKKVKKDKLPKDSLFIQNLNTGEIKKIANLHKWKGAKDGGDWLAYILDKEIKKKEEKKDTAIVKGSEMAKGNKEEKSTAGEVKEVSSLNEEEAEKKEKNEEKKKDKKKKKSFKSKGKPLVFYRPSTGDSLYVEKVTHYAIAELGTSAFVVQSVGDTTEVSMVLKFDPGTFTVDTIFNEIGKIAKISSDYKGTQCAFLFNNDTSKVKVDRLYHLGAKMKAPVQILDTIHPALSSEWSVLSKGSLSFSRDGSKLYFGAGIRPTEQPKDTLTSDEIAHVDVWNWLDKEIQPMQKKNLAKAKDPAYKCVYHIKDSKVVVLESEKFKNVTVPDKGNLNVGFAFVSDPYKRAQSWSGKWSNDVYKVDISTGAKSLLKENINGSSSFSETGKWFVYYEYADQSFYSLNVTTGVATNLTKDLTVSFVNEIHDTPSDPRAYGIVDFTKDDKSVLVYDRYDIWKLDLMGKKAPVCLTKGQGRETNTAFRYLKLDKEASSIDLKNELLLKSFNDLNKKSGYYKLNKSELSKIIEGDYSIYNPLKAKEADVYLWRKSTFKNYPEIRLSDASFSNEKVISNTNPQQKDYVWGDIQLVDWVASDGLVHQGLLVTPENMDPTKKYPMISYFYERYSDNLHNYRSPAPSRSTVNWNFYASNGYVIFIPDIYYRDGDPGLCAYEAVVSGCLAMSDQFDFIDREHMGIQGQSWGGYQVAHLVTRTNLFKAGMAGAPVSNMTSAYGGIRWGSGMSRMFQYEHTQSRIGGTLWEKTNKYIENSPVFFTPQVETPLLMMHNDKDGAVPWYQGIEYFMALRRLDKPAWLLVYNDEDHNLTRRANSKDLSRRMMQFFDHYLKGAAMPVWMHDGIPAVKKGKDLGYDLVE